MGVLFSLTIGTYLIRAAVVDGMPISYGGTYLV